jgi:hypothetical protein
MRMFNFLKSEKLVKGYIGYYNLTEWWLNTFSNKERDYILKVYAVKSDKENFEFAISNRGDSFIKK